MEQVKMVANKKHEAYNCNGRALSVIQAGESFTCDEGRAIRLVESGLAHYDLSANVGESDEQPETVAEPVEKFDGRTKAGRAQKGR